MQPTSRVHVELDEDRFAGKARFSRNLFLEVVELLASRAAQISEITTMYGIRGNSIPPQNTDQKKREWGTLGLK